jgi:hypothetical protein
LFSRNLPSLDDLSALFNRQFLFTHQNVIENSSKPVFKKTKNNFFFFSFLESKNPFKFLEKSIEINGETYNYYDLSHFKQVEKLPYSIRVLLESALRNCDNFHVKESDVTTILNWAEYKGEGSSDQNDYEIPFKPSRVILQDFTGVPAGN